MTIFMRFPPYSRTIMEDWEITKFAVPSIDRTYVVGVRSSFQEERNCMTIAAKKSFE